VLLCTTFVFLGNYPLRHSTQNGFCVALNKLGSKKLFFYAQKQTTYRPHENATYRGRLDDAETSAVDDANGRKGREDAIEAAGNNKDRSSPCCESENNAAELLRETERGFEGANTAQ
jgi:hypothetical protein